MSNRAKLCIGIAMMIIGLELRAVETFVLRPEATRILANFTGPSSETPSGAMRQFAVENTNLKKVLTPPGWLGWAFLSAGFVLTVYAARRLNP